MGGSRDVTQKAEIQKTEKYLPWFFLWLAMSSIACRQTDHQVVVALPSQEWVEPSSYVLKGEVKLGRVDHVIIGPQKTHVTVSAKNAEAKRVLETGPVVLKNGFLSVPGLESTSDD